MQSADNTWKFKEKKTKKKNDADDDQVEKVTLCSKWYMQNGIALSSGDILLFRSRYYYYYFEFKMFYEHFHVCFRKGIYIYTMR